MGSKVKQSKKHAKPAKSLLAHASASARLYGREKARKVGLNLKRKAQRKRQTIRPREDVVELAALLTKLASADLGVCDADMPLTSDMSVSEVERILLIRSLFKKFEDAPSEQADKLAISDFLSRNQKCADFKLEQKELFDDIIDGEVSSIIYDAVLPHWDSTFGLAQISAGFNVGPGASVGSEEGDFLTKVFHSPLTSTRQDLHTFYVYAIRGSSWAEAENARFQKYNLMMVAGSRLSTVPKNVDISRVICTEPVLNMLFQKGIGNVLEKRLVTAFGIDISKQPEINKTLARRGSMGENFCTIDLKGASDCISVSLCQTILPRALCNWLELTRSPVTRLPNGEMVKLNMISSMGNAYTFPLQTMIFAAVVKAVYRTMGLSAPRCDNVEPTYGVFGDDIIVCREAYEKVCQTLVRYGFTVNDSKSFSVGAFRESCGGDYWNGHLVRGVYCSSLKYDSDILSIYNRLVRWSARSGAFLDFTMVCLKNKVRQKLTVPYSEGDTCGFKVSYAIAQAQTASLLSTRSPFYRAFRPKVRSYAVPLDSNDWVVKDGHCRVYNGNAILVTLLGGFIRDGRIGFRENSTTRYHVRWVSSPNWDYIPLADAKSHRGGDWKVFADYYFNK